jgi:hypothetical protein
VGGTGDDAGVCGLDGSAGAVKATPGATTCGAAAADWRPVVVVRFGAVVAGALVVGAAAAGAGASVVGAAVLGAVGSVAGESAAGAVDVSRDICFPPAGWTTATPAPPSTRHTPIRSASKPGVRRDVTRG